MSNKITTNLIKSSDKSNGMIIGQESDSSYIKNYNNKLDMIDRIFYTKENGNVFECFNNKPMKSINAEELKDLLMYGRQKQVSFVSIAEQQVNELKKIIRDKKLRTISRNHEITITSYHIYNIISDEEYKELMELLRNQS